MSEAINPRKRGRDKDNPDAGSSSIATESMSIDETNKLRASLGLPLLSTHRSSDDVIEDQRKQKEAEEAAMSAEAKEHEVSALREEIEKRKKQRLETLQMASTTLGDMLASTPTLSSAAAWAEANRKKKEAQEAKTQEQRTSKKRKERSEAVGNTYFDDLDKAFEVTKTSSRPKTKANYNTEDLKGLRVAHNAEEFGEEQTVVLTLKDKTILKRKDGKDYENEEEDILENVNLVELQKVKRNEELKKKTILNKYDAYGERDGVADILSQYDDKPAEVEGIRLGQAEQKAKREGEVRARLNAMDGGAGINVAGGVQYDLGYEKKIASDYYTQDELASFRKRKIKKERKTHIKREAAAVVDEEDIETKPNAHSGTSSSLDALGISASSTATELATSSDHGSRDRRHKSKEDAAKAAVEQKLKDQNYLRALHRASERTAEMKETVLGLKNGETKDAVKKESTPFVAIPTAVDEDDGDAELQRALERARRITAVAQQRASVKNELDSSSTAPISERSVRSLAESIHARALSSAVKKEPGTEEEVGLVFTSTTEFARNIEIEQDDPQERLKRYGLFKQEPAEDEMDVDDKSSAAGTAAARVKTELAASATPMETNGDEHGSESEDDGEGLFNDEPLVSTGTFAALVLAKRRGMIQHSAVQVGRAKDETLDTTSGGGPRIEHLDEYGRPMKPKEAYRALSHAFHGKKPGKKKQEKILKKMQEETLQLTKDPVLQVAKKQHDLQKKMGKAFIVLDAKGNEVSAISTISKEAPREQKTGKEKEKDKEKPGKNVKTEGGAYKGGKEVSFGLQGSKKSTSSKMVASFEDDEDAP